MTKRRFSRIPLNFPARLIVDGAEVYDVHEIVNLSIGGCLVALTEDVKQGTRCTMTVRLAGGLGNTTVNVTGKVVRQDAQFVAIQFTRIGPDDLYHLQNLIRYNSPNPEQIDDEIKNHPGLI